MSFLPPKHLVESRCLKATDTHPTQGDRQNRGYGLKGSQVDWRFFYTYLQSVVKQLIFII